MHIILATKNQHKVREIKQLLPNFSFLSLDDVETPPEIIEDGLTFHDNALKKARIISRHYGMPALADDSGLEVECLNDDPGVFSARFAGENASDAENNEKLLDLMKNISIEQRNARFVCVIALAREGFASHTFMGKCNGYIATEEKGNQGFGYDPLFFYPPFDKTFGEVSAHKKNTVSHRSHALRKTKRFIEKNQDYFF